MTGRSNNFLLPFLLIRAFQFKVKYLYLPEGIGFPFRVVMKNHDQKPRRPSYGPVSDQSSASLLQRSWKCLLHRRGEASSYSLMQAALLQQHQQQQQQHQQQMLMASLNPMGSMGMMNPFTIFMPQLQVQPSTGAMAAPTAGVRAYSKHDPRWNKTMETYEASCTRLNARGAPWNWNDDSNPF